MTNTEGASATATPTLVTGVDFVLLNTKDIDKAVEFYGGVLGLPEGKRWQHGEGRPLGVEFETGTVTLAVMEPEQIGRGFERSAGAIALQVEDVERVRDELKGRGVEFFGETLDSGVCYQAFFSDPDGNNLILHQRYAAQHRRDG